MPKKEKSNGSVRGVIRYDQDSRKKTYHRYQVIGEVGGKQIVGQVYIPFGLSGKVKKLVLAKEG